MNRRATLAWHGAVLAGSLALALSQTGLWRNPAAETFLGPDPENGAWILSTVSHNLLTRPWDPFAGNLYYPVDDPAVYANALVGPALLVAPLRLWTANPVLLYNVAILTALVLTGYGFWLLARRLWSDPVAALVPAIAIPFCAHQSHHMLQLNIVAITGFPYLIWGVLELLERPRASVAVLTGLVFALQGMSCGYYGMAATLLCLVLGTWGWRHLARPRVAAWAAAAAVVAALASAPYVLAFRAAPRMERSVGTSAAYSLDLPEDLVRTRARVWQGILPGRGDSAFAGLGVLALAAAGLWKRRRDRYAWLCLAVAAVFFALALGPWLKVGAMKIPLPYAWLYEHVPLVRAGRHPVTFVLQTVMATGLLAAAGASALGLTRGWRAVLLVAVTVAEIWSPPLVRGRRQPPPAEYAALEALPPGAMLELPFDVSSHQWWAIGRDRPTANGTLPHAPPSWLTLAQWFQREFRAEPPRDMSGMRSLRYLLAHFPIRYVVAHSGTPGEWIRNIEATTGVFELAVELDGVWIYRVKRSGAGSEIRRAVPARELERGVRAEVRTPPAVSLVVRADGEEVYRGDPANGSVFIDLAGRAGDTGLIWLELATEPSAELELVDLEVS